MTPSAAEQAGEAPVFCLAGECSMCGDLSIYPPVTRRIFHHYLGDWVSREGARMMGNKRGLPWEIKDFRTDLYIEKGVEALGPMNIDIIPYAVTPRAENLCPDLDNPHGAREQEMRVMADYRDVKRVSYDCHLSGPAVITFATLPVGTAAAPRLHVRLCEWHPAVREYLTALLKYVAVAWPDTQAEVDRFLQDNGLCLALGSEVAVANVALQPQPAIPLDARSLAEQPSGTPSAGGGQGTPSDLQPAPKAQVDGNAGQTMRHRPRPAGSAAKPKQHRQERVDKLDWPPIWKTLQREAKTNPDLDLQTISGRDAAAYLIARDIRPRREARTMNKILRKGREGEFDRKSD
jgi:hypothetical protein